MTTALEARDYEGLLEKREDRLQALLAGSDINPAQFIGMTVQALARDPKLLAPDIDRDSLLLAIMTVAEMGLTPTGQGGAHLVPYMDRKKGRKIVQAIVDWRGFIKMAMRSGQITYAKAELVYAGDQFEYQLGDEPRLFHTPTLQRPEDPERGDITHVYAVAHLTNGERVFEVMTMTEIGAIRDRIRNLDDDSPWVTHPGEQYRKTAIRRLFKYLPVAVSPAMLAALDREDEWEDRQVVVSRPPRPALTSRQQRLLEHATGSSPDAEEAPGSPAEATDGSADPGTPEKEPQGDGLPELPA